MTDDLTAWLLRQIDEDEATTREEIARRARWQAEQEARAAFGAVNAIILLPFDDPGAVGDPARILAECEAKRRIIRWVNTWPWRPEPPSSVDGLLPALALPYANRPGYREEWRP